LLKIRTESTEALQAVLRDIYKIKGVSGTQTIVALETFFERPVYVGSRA
ncbi:MAG TPA: Lrp/AsnC ligand binding domain-containing protein, partial [Micromonosporaceae bacterium]